MRIARSLVSFLLLPLVSLALIAGASPAAAQGEGPMKWVVLLSGDQQRPDAVMTDAIGTALVTFDPSSFEISVAVNVVNMDVSDLLDIPTVGPFHLHVREAGADNGAIAVEFGTSADWMQGTGGIALMATGTIVSGFDGDSVMDAMIAGLTYLNLHTQTYMGGEIRGDLPGKEVPVPEPVLGALLLLGAAGLPLSRRRRP